MRVNSLRCKDGEFGVEIPSAENCVPCSNLALIQMLRLRGKLDLEHTISYLCLSFQISIIFHQVDSNSSSDSLELGSNLTEIFRIGSDIRSHFHVFACVMFQVLISFILILKFV